MNQKTRIKNALKELLSSDKVKIEVPIKDNNINIKPFPKLLFNKFIFKIQRKIIPCHFKNWLLGLTGTKVGYDACIPHDINFDPYFPELINIRKGCLVGGSSNIYAHRIKNKKLILGKVIFEERTLMGGGSDVMPGSAIGKNAILNMWSVLDKEIPEGELWGGKPAKLMVKFTQEQIDKYFKPSNKDKNYYREFKKTVKAFRKDPKQNFFKIQYNGKRLNAGDEWFLARNTLKIFWSGVFVELARVAKWSWLRVLFYGLAGAKIGKNVKIGKGVVLDHLNTDLITIEDNVVLEDYAYIDGHEYTVSQTIFGKALIKKGTHIKHHAYIRTGTTIGENTTIEANSFAQKEIPANEVWGGFPAAKFIRKKD